MKKKKLALLSLLLCAAMLFTTTASTIALQSTDKAVFSNEATTQQITEPVIGNEPFINPADIVFENITKDNVPSIVGYDSAIEKGHVARMKGEEKDLYSLIFRNADGSNTLYMYSDPVKFIDKDGNIKDKSNKIIADKNSYINRDNDIRVSFPQALTDGVKLAYNDINITLKPKAQTKTAESFKAFKTSKDNEDLIRYDGVFGKNTYLTYKPEYMGFKEDIILTEQTGQSEFEFTLLTGGLELYKDTSDSEGGSLYLRNNKGEMVASLGEVIIFTADNGNNSFGAYEFITVRENEEYTVIIKVDPDYLKDPKTTYPVTIDPTIIINANAIYDINYYGQNIEDARISIGAMGGVGSGTETQTKLGVDYNGQGTSRMLVKFPVLYTPINNDNISTFSLLHSDQIISAYIKTYIVAPANATATYIQSYAYTTSWNENTVVGNISTWNSYHDTSTLSSTNVGTSTTNVNINIINAVKSWCDYNRGVTGGRNPAYGLMLKNEVEGSNPRTIYTSENQNPMCLIINYTLPNIGIAYSNIRENETLVHSQNNRPYITIQNYCNFPIRSSKVLFQIKNGTEVVWSSIQYTGMINSNSSINVFSDYISNVNNNTTYTYYVFIDGQNEINESNELDNYINRTIKFTSDVNEYINDTPNGSIETSIGLFGYTTISNNKINDHYDVDWFKITMQPDDNNRLRIELKKPKIDNTSNTANLAMEVYSGNPNNLTFEGAVISNYDDIDITVRLNF